MEANQVLTWTLISECEVPNDVKEMLIEGEEAVVAYKTIRDCAIFTTKRLIVRDSQGITGKKIEVYSLPYNSINMWSVETAGIIDVNSEVELWTRAGHIKIKLSRGVNVKKFDNLMASVTLK